MKNNFEEHKENKKSYYQPPMNISELCNKYNMEAGSEVNFEKQKDAELEEAQKSDQHLIQKIK